MTSTVNTLIWKNESKDTGNMLRPKSFPVRKTVREGALKSFCSSLLSSLTGSISGGFENLSHRKYFNLVHSLNEISHLYPFSYTWHIHCLFLRRPEVPVRSWSPCHSFIWSHVVCKTLCWTLVLDCLVLYFLLHKFPLLNEKYDCIHSGQMLHRKCYRLITTEGPVQSDYQCDLHSALSAYFQNEV